MQSLGIALIVIGLAPFAIYFTLKRPLIFPLGLYIMMVPADGLLLNSSTATLTRFVAIVSAVALLFHMIIQRRVLAPPKSWAVWGVYMLLASLTALWTIDTDRTFFTISQLLALYVFFTLLAMYPADRKDVRIVGAIIVASGVVFAGWGLADYLTGTRFESRLSVFLSGTMLDPNHAAASLLLPIALAVGTLLETRNIWLRLASLISSIVMVWTLFLTGSRGGLIALAVMLLYIAWRTRYRFQILALMAIGGLGSLLAPTVWDRFADKDLGGGSGRLFIWDVARLALKDHWLAGAGIGAFPTAYNHALFSIYQPVFQGWSRPSHNTFLCAFVELGIFGGVLHIYAWYRSWSDSRGNIVIEAAVVGLAIASLFLDVLWFKYIWLAFMMAVLVKNAAEPRYLRGEQRPPVQTGRARIVVRRRVPWRGPQWVATAAERDKAVGL
jgi:O-antigen ligase